MTGFPLSWLKTAIGLADLLAGVLYGVGGISSLVGASSRADVAAPNAGRHECPTGLGS